VDVIEAGFPISSPGDFESVETMRARSRARHLRLPAREKGHPHLCQGASSRRTPRIHTFIGTSTIHREKKLHRTPRDPGAGHAKCEAGAQQVRHVQFSAEDAAAPSPNSCAVWWRPPSSAAPAHQHSRHVGYTTPEIFGHHRQPDEQLPNVTRPSSPSTVTNDLGMATANSINRGQARGAPGGMHHQRHRRTRWQRGLEES